MTKLPPVVRNAFFSVFQIIVSAIVLFILYRFLIRSLGIEQLGIWSVVLSAASANKIGEIGLSGGMIRYVSKYLSIGDTTSASEIIQTGILTIAFIVGLLLFVSYPLIKLIIGHFIPEAECEMAYSIIPVAMVSLWFNSTAAIFISSLEGCQRYDRRSILLISGNVILLLSAFFYVPKMGLGGVAWAYLTQAIFNHIASWAFLKMELKSLPVLSFRWRLSRFREMLSYGANIQTAMIFGMLYEPTTKLILSKFGGLAMTGYYEMANRMVLQFRGLLVSANQVIVPVIADIKEKTPKRVFTYFTDTYEIFMFLGISFHMTLILLVPAISKIWMGTYQPAFIIFGVLLSIGWLFNTLNTPAYFISMGIGRLKWNTISHIVIGCMNIGLSYLLGYIFGGYGVIGGWVFSLATGSMIITIGYLTDNQIPLKMLFPQDSRMFAIVSVVGTILLFIIFNRIPPFGGYVISGLLSVTGYLSLILIAFWCHPKMKKIIRDLI